MTFLILGFAVFSAACIVWLSFAVLHLTSELDDHRTRVERLQDQNLDLREALEREREMNAREFEERLQERHMSRAQLQEERQRFREDFEKIKRSHKKMRARLRGNRT